MDYVRWLSFPQTIVIRIAIISLVIIMINHHLSAEIRLSVATALARLSSSNLFWTPAIKKGESDFSTEG